MEKNYSTGNCPVAFIAKNKQRMKQFNNQTVYLKNGEEFEIELFNPTKTKVLAKIEMDGKSIGPGIILRPGERVFLERYVNDARKFKFDTYEVNGNNDEVKKAIEDNGNVTVKFHREETISSPYVWYNGASSFYQQPLYDINCGTATLGFSGTARATGLSTSCCTQDFHMSEPVSTYAVAGAAAASGELSRSTTRSININNTRSKLSKTTMDTKAIMETGRVEKGSRSDQIFDADYTKFRSSWEWKSEWKILPESRKQIVAEDLVVYCAKCGRRRRTNERYCPACGFKF